MMGRRLQIQYRMMLADLGVPPWIINWLIMRLKTDTPPDQKLLETLVKVMVESLAERGVFRLSSRDVWTRRVSVLPVTIIPHYAVAQWAALNERIKR